jgi:endonuclease/exonuclease/phosphatase family metal-dependent hydrolase
MKTLRPHLVLLVTVLWACGEPSTVLRSSYTGAEGEGEEGEELVCSGPVDQDRDGTFAPCGPFSVAVPDCDDADQDNWVSCVACVDADGDDAWVGCDAYDGRSEDCDDGDPAVQECSTCRDEDGDGYETGCTPAEGETLDCDDTDPDNWESCSTCKDKDQDGYFVGCDLYANREGPDCNDASATASTIISGVCGGPKPPVTTAPKVIRLRVGSFNTLFRGFDHKYPAHTWKSRLPSVKVYLRSRDYDFFGFQEVWGDQVQYVDLRSSLPATHAMTKNATHIRKNAIAYRKTRFALEAQGFFKVAGEASKYATWGRFRDLVSGKRLFVFNAHLSAHFANARTEGARKLVSEIARINTTNLPVLLIGDMNSSDTAAPADVIKAHGFRNVRAFATVKTNLSNNTHHGFRATPPRNGFHIDHVYVKGGVAKVQANVSRTDVEKPLGQYTSDHFPLMGDVTLTY